MRFYSVLISSFFTSAVLVESGVINSYAGLIFIPDDSGYVRHVSGTFNVPDISLSGIDTPAFAFVGIGGTSNCSTDILLHLGVKIAVMNNGQGQYSVAYRYTHYDGSYILFDAAEVPIRPNDTVKLTVDLPLDGTLGVVTAENLTNQKNRTHEVKLPGIPCGQAAVWAVEEDDDPSNDIGPFTFSNIQYSGRNIGSGQWDATNITIGATFVTKIDAVADDSSFTITW